MAFVATPNPWSNSPAGSLDICPQMGDPRKITCFGGIEVVFRNGTIWAAHEIFLPADAPTRSAIQWWQLAPDGGVVQRGRLDDASGVLFKQKPNVQGTTTDTKISRISGVAARTLENSSRFPSNVEELRCEERR